jgi:hypothetical protein
VRRYAEVDCRRVRAGSHQEPQPAHARPRGHPVLQSLRPYSAPSVERGSHALRHNPRRRTRARRRCPARARTALLHVDDLAYSPSPPPVYCGYSIHDVVRKGRRKAAEVWVARHSLARLEVNKVQPVAQILPDVGRNSERRLGDRVRRRQTFSRRRHSCVRALQGQRARLRSPTVHLRRLVCDASVADEAVPADVRLLRKHREGRGGREGPLPRDVRGNKASAAGAWFVTRKNTKRARNRLPEHRRSGLRRRQTLQRLLQAHR